MAIIDEQAIDLTGRQPLLPGSEGGNVYVSLLVPLDRSPFAEQAIPLAASIARRTKGRLELVEVHALYALTEPAAAWSPFDPDCDAECKRQEQLYLAATAKWVASVTPVRVTAGVISGSTVLPETVADSILERARTGNADLIVMTTHGRGPLNRIGLGSVADELIRRATIPVLLVRPEEKPVGIIPELVLDNFLIPLDGSALAEQVLEEALDLAVVMEARCSLVRVVEARPSPAHRGAGGMSEAARAEAYLEGVAARVRGKGLQVRTRVIVAPHAVEAILEEAAAQACNLIALATHGRGGFKRLLLGSVADRLIRAAASPVLVYRPTSKEF